MICDDGVGIAEIRSQHSLSCPRGALGSNGSGVIGIAGHPSATQEIGAIALGLLFFISLV